MPEHVLSEAVARPQVEDMWPIHNREDHQERNAATMLGRDNRDVVVELGLVQRPDQLLRRLGNLRLGGHQPVPRLRVLGNPLKLGVEIGRGEQSWHGYHRASPQAQADVSLALPDAAFGSDRGRSSSLTSRSSRRISMWVRRSLRLVTSERIGRLSCVSTWVIVDSIALRNGAELVSQVSSIVLVAWAYASVFTI